MKLDIKRQSQVELKITPEVDREMGYYVWGTIIAAALIDLNAVAFRVRVRRTLGDLLRGEKSIYISMAGCKSSVAVAEQIVREIIKAPLMMSLKAHFDIVVDLLAEKYKGRRDEVRASLLKELGELDNG